MRHPGKHFFCREVSRRLSLFCAFSPMQRPPDGKQSIGQRRRSAMSAVSPVQILKIRRGIIRFRIIQSADRLYHPEFLRIPFLRIFTGIRNYPFFLFHPVLPSCSCRPPGIISLRLAVLLAALPCQPCHLPDLAVFHSAFRFQCPSWRMIRRISDDGIRKASF